MPDLSALQQPEKAGFLSNDRLKSLSPLFNVVLPIIVALAFIGLSFAIHKNLLPTKVKVLGKTIYPKKTFAKVNKIYLVIGAFTVGSIIWLGLLGALDLLFFLIPLFLLALTIFGLYHAKANELIVAERSFYFLVIFVVCEIVYYFFRVQRLESVIAEGGIDKKLDKRVSSTERSSVIHRAGERKAEKKEAVSEEESREQELDQIRSDFLTKKMRFSTILLMIKTLAGTIDRDEIFTTLMKILEKGLGAKKAQLWMYDERLGELFIVHSLGMKRAESESINIKPEEENFIATAYRERVFMGEIQAGQDPTKKAMIGKAPVGTILTAPIIGEDKTAIGVINISEMTNPEYDSDQTNLLHTTSDIAGLVMKNARLLLATKDELQSAKALSEEQLKEKEELKSAFGKYVSPQVIEQMMKDPEMLQLGGRLIPCTLFFSDVRGFTKMSESMEPPDIVSILNEYFTEMCEILYSHEGTLDKFVGDEMMAIFGAPIAHEDDNLRAVFCAIYMQQAMKTLQDKWESENKPRMAIGIGIHRGNVTVGNIGSERSMDYTAIGDVVNTASRIMSVAARDQILISREVYEDVRDFVEVTELEPVSVKGKSEPIEVFQVSGIIRPADFEGTSVEYGPTTKKSEFDGDNVMDSVDVQELIKQAQASTFAENISAEDLTKSNVKLEKQSFIECGNCSHENDPNEKFCGKCGMPVF
ncbi:adenylate/guanylate cyclase domain-containing protein [Candidatus Riflebacteria bacterium]